MMSPDESEPLRRERLSALLDGELEATHLVGACEGWHCDGGARHDWHSWHLIGDVLRSEDLASDPVRDQRLLAVVRERLAGEPAIVAPMPASRRFRWQLPTALAAGVALVVGTVAVTRSGSDPDRLVAVAAEGGATTSAGGQMRLAGDVGAERSTDVRRLALANGSVDRQLIRDARLDRYLEAHKQFAGSSALGVPSVFLSGATVDSSAR